MAASITSSRRIWASREPPVTTPFRLTASCIRDRKSVWSASPTARQTPSAWGSGLAPATCTTAGGSLPMVPGRGMETPYLGRGIRHSLRPWAIPPPMSASSRRRSLETRLKLMAPIFGAFIPGARTSCFAMARSGFWDTAPTISCRLLPRERAGKLSRFLISEEGGR